jgi:hypothetical protein
MIVECVLAKRMNSSTRPTVVVRGQFLDINFAGVFADNMRDGPFRQVRQAVTSGLARGRAPTAIAPKRRRYPQISAAPFFVRAAQRRESAE